MRKRAVRMILTTLVAALMAGSVLPPALAAAKEGGDGWPLELQDYRERVEGAQETLREPLKKVRELVEQLKQGREQLFSLLGEKGRGAAEYLSSDLRDYLWESGEVFRRIRQVTSGINRLRSLKRRAVRAALSGDLQKAAELIEVALGRVDEVRGWLESLTSELEALCRRQAELLDRVRQWSPPPEEGDAGGAENA